MSLAAERDRMMVTAHGQDYVKRIPKEPCHPDLAFLKPLCLIWAIVLLEQADASSI